MTEFFTPNLSPLVPALRQTTPARRTATGSAVNTMRSAPLGWDPEKPEHVRILLVEDVDSDAMLIEGELRRSKVGFELFRVETRDEFCEALGTFNPELILADYTLPQFGAIEALNLLREFKSDIPLLLVTGSHSEEIAVECMREGADDYILKASLRRLPSAVRNTMGFHCIDRLRSP